MPIDPTRLNGRRLLACLGMVGAMATQLPAHAQADAKTALVEQGNYWQSMGRVDLAEEPSRRVVDAIAEERHAPPLFRQR